ncbi:MAG: hypothetical protein AMXMBFR59_21530 [Rhodanobacteraceae bacterium]
MGSCRIACLTIFPVLCWSVAAAGTAVAETAPLSTEQQGQIQEVVHWLSGSFGNRLQAARDAAFADVVMHLRPIWTERASGPWLYVEQAAAATPAQPYRQRIYHIHWSGAGPVSDVYTLPGDPAAYVGGWRDDAVFTTLKPDDLRRKEGCSLHLTRSSDGSYRGSTVGRDCASERQGANYATSEVTLNAASLTSWDRGFTTDGVQPWGPAAGPYRFDRLPHE